MAERKIKAGVTLMQDFCRPASDEFNGYIDYLDREDAQRNNAISTFNLFNDYMGNPIKSTGLFTTDRDVLDYPEKKELKSIFKLAQKNESIMWQTVISFDNLWLEKNGLYDQTEKTLDEQKIREVSRRAIDRLLKSEGLENAVWSAGIHYNTDNIHVHFAIVEPYPMRKKMLYQGKWEVRGKFKLSNINRSKSTVVNEIMHTKEVNLRINNIIRKNIVEHLKEHELAQDPEMKERFLELCNQLADMPKNQMNYNNAAMASCRNKLDEISKYYLDQYCIKEYTELIDILDRQSSLYEEAYGGGNFGYYKEDKLHDLMQRMGNATLKQSKEYLDKLNERVIELDDKEMPSAEGHFGIHERNGWENELESQNQPDVPELNFQEGDESFTVIGGEKIVDFREEVKRAEQYFEEIRNEKQENLKKGDFKTYFYEFKEIQKILYDTLQLEDPGETKKFVNKIPTKEHNPFIKLLLGEMYLYGQNVEVSPAMAQGYFAEALIAFEEAVYDLPDEPVRKYMEYQIGKLYDQGWGVEEDPEIAAEWYEKADTNYSRYALGKLYYKGRGVEQSYERAFDLFSSAKGNPFANLECGKMCAKGIGTEVDIDKSESFNKIAFKELIEVENKHPDDLLEYRLGNMLYYGTGCEPDVRKAAFYLQKAVKQKNPSAILLLSHIYLEEGIEEKILEMIDPLKELSVKGDNAAAQYTLGKIYLIDHESYNLKEGESEYKKAADQGHEYAQYQLGKLYLDRSLEICDIKKGIEYLEKSKAQGNVGSQYLLAREYLSKNSEAFDPKKGIAYMTELAESGNEWGQLSMGMEYIKGENVKKNLHKASEWFEKAAAQGNETAEAMMNDLSVKQRRIGRKADPLGELDKAMIALRRSFYEAQEETRKNILLYEYELENSDLQIEE